MTKRRPFDLYQQGLLAGALAGAIMSGWMMAWDGLSGDGVWTMPQLIATILMGPGAYLGGQFRLVPVAVGFALHELTSAAMGLAFVFLLRLLRQDVFPVAGALVYGLASWAVAQLWLIPALSETMARHVEPLQLAVGHAVFGLALGIICIWLAER